MILVERVKAIVTKPPQEWPVIAAESTSIQQIFTGYVMILVAIPTVASFIGWSLVGVGGAFGGYYRVPLAQGVAYMVLNYILMLGAVYALALVIDGFAPQFGGQKDFMQALKVAAYSPTPAWLAGVFSIIPLLSIFSLLGALWSLYLLYTGLPALMKTPEDKTIPYTVVVLIAIIILAALSYFVANLTIPSTARGY
jgi:Yip1-like protein